MSGRIFAVIFGDILMLEYGNIEVYYSASPNRETFIMPNKQPIDSAIKDWWGETYYNYLNATYSHEQFSLTSFKFGAGYIDLVKRDREYPYQRVNDYRITYVAARIHRDKYIFFFVNSIDVLPDRLRLNIELDNWGTYIGAASIKHVHFNRSNIQLNKPIQSKEIRYQMPEFARANEATPRSIPVYLKDNGIMTVDDLSIVATIEFGLKQSFADSVETIQTIAFNPRAVARASETGSFLLSDFIKACEWVQSIYSVTIGLEEIAAKVINIYVLPIWKPPYRNEISPYDFNGLLKNNDLTPKYEEKQTKGEPIHKAGEYSKKIIINNNMTSEPIIDGESIVNVNAIGARMVFGTKFEGIEIPRFAGCCGVEFRIENALEQVNVKVRCEGSETDITDSFKIAGIANTNTLTFEQRIGKLLGITASVAGGAFQIAAGGAGIVSGAAAISQQLAGGYKQPVNGSPIKGGQGYLTIEDIFDGLTPTILFINIYDGETALDPTIVNYEGLSYLNNYGAECQFSMLDTYNFFSYINACPLLSEYPSGINLQADIFIACDAEINNIPSDAADSIKNSLANGIRVITIEVNN